MGTVGLLPSQTRWIQETAEAAGFPWTEFRLSSMPSMVVTGQYPVLRHEPTNATFAFDDVTHSTGQTEASGCHWIRPDSQ